MHAFGKKLKSVCNEECEKDNQKREEYVDVKIYFELTLRQLMSYIYIYTLEYNKTLSVYTEGLYYTFLSC